jgi:hypothetical protein
VAIFVGERCVAENSSSQIGRVRGSCGFRSLAQWGHVDLLVRLPSADETFQLSVNGNFVVDMPVINDTAYCPVRAWGQAFGFVVSWDNSTNTVSFDGQSIDTPLRMIGGHGCLPIRVLVAAAGLDLSGAPPNFNVVTNGADGEND